MEMPSGEKTRGRTHGTVMKREIETWLARAGRTWLLWLGIVGAASGVSAQESVPAPGGDAPEAGSLEGRESDAGPAADEERESSRPLTPAEESALIQKPRIAEETYERLQGLREAGNPHIRKGLKIANLRDHPERAQVDLEKLRAEAIARIENREGFHRPVHSEAESAAGGEEVAHSHDHGGPSGQTGPHRASDSPPSQSPVWWSLVLVVATSGLSLAGVIWASRR